MREVSIFFQCETADRPASNPSRKPSSVSPRAVLIDIPVIAMRSFFDKINLHYAECTNGVIPHDLTGTDRLKLVLLDCGCRYIEPFPGADLMKKCRMMDADESNIECTLAGEMKQAQAELRHRFDQQNSRVNGVAWKVAGEYRIGRGDEPLSPEPRRIQIDLADRVHEQKRITMWNQAFNL